MSKTTTNFNLIKPELADPADITALNSNWDKIDSELANAGTPRVSATSTNGVAYTATVPFLTELVNGLEIIIIPTMTSTSTSPTLNVNGLGAKSIRLPLSSNTSGTVAPSTAGFFVANKPVKIMYDATYGSAGAWRTVDKQKVSANDLYGVTPMENGGTNANDGADGLKNLFAAGATVLSSHQYGDTLPSPGTPGRIFFKRVTS